MDFSSEVGHFFEKLSTWREELNNEFSNILTFHSSSLRQGIKNLAEEVSDLKVELSIITKERNDLLETVHNLGNDIRKRNAELPLPEPEEIHSNDIPEVEENHELRIETSNMQSETVDSDDTTFTTNLDNVEHARDEVMNEKANEENHKQVTEDDGGKLGINNGIWGLFWVVVGIF